MAQEESVGCTICRDWSAEPASLCYTAIAQCHRKCVVLHIDRQSGIESHGAHHKLTRLSIHCAR